MTHDLLLISPMIVICGMGLLVMLADVFALKSKKQYLAYLTAIGAALAALPTLYLLKKGGGAFVNAYFASMLTVNNYSLFFTLLILGVVAMVALLSAKYNEDNGCPYGEFYSLLNFAAFGMLVLVASNNMVSIFLGLETMSISSYVLAGIRRRYLRSTEASFKYFVMGAFSTAILLYGVALIYGATGHTNLHLISSTLAKLKAAKSLPLGLVAGGFGMILVGFGFKIAAVPFHSWAPDVYEGAPTPITAFFAAGVKAASFAALIKVLITLNVDRVLPEYLQGQQVLYWLAILTMFVGNLVALWQTNIKRMLAYSSIAHAGYLLIGLMAANYLNKTGGAYPPAIGAIMFYFVAYAAATLGAFIVIALFARGGEERVNVEDFGGLAQRYPALALLMLLFMMSLAGLPPTAGFIGKYMLFKEVLTAGSASQSQSYFLLPVILAVLNSVISVYYYLRVVIVMYMRPGQGELGAAKAPAAIAALVAAAFLTLHAGVFPERYLDVARKSGNSIQVHAPVPKRPLKKRAAQLIPKRQ